MKRSIPQLHVFLMIEANRLSCSIDELDFDDDYVNYEKP